MALSAGKRGTALTHLRFEPAIHLGDEFPRIRQLGGAAHFVFGRIRPPVADIFIHRARKEKVVLEDDADLLAIDVVVQRAQIMVVDADHSR